ncbi:hypothetical protein LZ31DRAFT_559114 [Colletotrichum somersetense]|nr:hypothetical protein LZ31DRAFT_559114 [Colletotrichum somersetense]
MGSYNELVSLPAWAPLHLIQTRTFAKAAGVAATLPVSYAAPLQVGIKPGWFVLFHAAAGRLSLVAIRLAIATGCHIIGTAGSPEKRHTAEKSGARSCVSHPQEAAC